MSGTTVAVAWIGDANGAVRTRVSANRGSTWGTPLTVSPQSIGSAGIAARGSRIAVTWTTGDDVVVRERIGATWAAPVVVASLDPAADSVPYAPAVSLQDPHRVAVAWAEETDSPSNVDLRWSESADDGGHWFQPETLWSHAATSARRVNDWPSIVWPSAGTRYVVWNGSTYGTNSYRLFLRKGAGTPVGLSSVGATWVPGPAIVAQGVESGPTLRPYGTDRHR